MESLNLRDLRDLDTQSLEQWLEAAELLAAFDPSAREFAHCVRAELSARTNEQQLSLKLAV